MKEVLIFFTVVLKNRQLDYLTLYIDALRDAFTYTKKQKPFEIIAIVILPEHLHCIWQLPEADGDYPGRWRGIKSHFTRALLKKGVTLVKNKRGEYNLWQARYWEHAIRSEEDLSRHIDYIHYNPVKHGWVTSVSDWPFSSFHQYVENQQMPLHWGSKYIESVHGYGE